MSINQLQSKLAEAADYIDALEAENGQLKEELYSISKLADARGLADRMVSQGAIDASDLETKTAELFESTPEDLEVTRKAVELYGDGMPPGGTAKLAHAYDSDGQFLPEGYEQRDAARRSKFIEALIS